LWQRYELRTRLVGWDEKWLYLEQEFVAEGKTYASAYVKGLFRGRDGSVSTAEFLRAAGFELVSPPLPEAVRQWQALDQSLS
ncbi:MAG: thioesterase family protein, partial [Gemmatimonadales bacterium]